MRPRAIGVLLAVTFLGCASGGGQDPADDPMLTERAPGEMPLAPGDAVKLSFSREPELNGSYTIDESGLANLPLLGQRQLIDRPAAQAKEELAAEYAERVRNQSVQVTYTRRVRVLGEVRNPGLYQVDPTMTFDDAIALAGGATNEGNLENVRLIRQGEEIVEGLDVSRSVAASIESGDQLYVPKTSWFSRYGAVLIGATISAIGVILAFTN
jgi:protein involved in polysaccharide export with SLBB domain